MQTAQSGLSTYFNWDDNDNDDSDDACDDDDDEVW